MPSAISATRGGLAVAGGELVLLAALEGGRGRVRDDGDAGVEDLGGGARPVAVLAARGGLEHAPDRCLQLALVAAPGAPEQLRVAEAVRLQERQQLAVGQVEVDRGEPGAQQRPRVVRAHVGRQRAGARVAVGHHALDHPQHDARVRRRAGAAPAEHAHGDRHRGVRPLGGGALGAVRLDAAVAQVGEELGRVRGGRRLRPGAADVDAGVVVGAADADAAVGVDVDRGRAVELGRAGAVADLPDVEQLGEPAPVARGQRRRDGEEGVRERARDLPLAEVLRDHLDVVRVGLQPVVVVGRDAEAEDVHGLRLAGEARGQLLGDERVGTVGDRQRAVDRVVVGDRHEVHAAALGEGVDLLGRRGALGQAERAGDAELGDRGGGRVAVQVGPGGRRVVLACRHAADSPCKSPGRVTVR